MIAGLVSDTHGNIDALVTSVKLMGNIDMLIHLGDFGTDVRKVPAHLLPDKVIAVKGNCDSSSDLENELVMEMNDHEFFVTHGNSYYPERSIDGLVETARRKGCTGVLFGHTHKPFYLYENGFLVFNPGHMHPGSKYGTYGILKIQNGEISGEIKAVNNKIERSLT